MTATADIPADSHSVVLCLGSNVHDRQGHLDRAVEALQPLLTGSVRMSTAYMTPSHSGFGAAYLNCVMIAQTSLTVAELTARIKAIEKDEGRTPQSKAEGHVPLDIDIVMYDGHILREADYAALHFRLGYSRLV